MDTYASNADLDLLKVQMQILKNHLADNEIVSQEMLDATVKTQVRSLTSHPVAYLVGLAGEIFIAAFTIYAHAALGTVSLWFTIATVIFCVVCTCSMYMQYRLKVRENILGDALVDTAGEIARWRAFNIRQTILAAVTTIIYVGCIFMETGSALMQSAKYMFIALFIVSFVIGSVARNKYKIHKTTTELLWEIERVKG